MCHRPFAVGVWEMVPQNSVISLPYGNGRVTPASQNSVCSWKFLRNQPHFCLWTVEKLNDHQAHISTLGVQK